jgi:hypothetical protein
MLPRNRYDLHELAGAFGDLGTLIPFVLAYVSLLRLDPAGVLLPFGISLIVVGVLNRTPFPVQPMKAIGAAAITQTAGAVALTPAMVVLLIAGAVVAIVQQPTLAQELSAMRPALRLPAFAWPSLGWQDLWLGALLLALPQLPPTFGNALIAITE